MKRTLLAVLLGSVVAAHAAFPSKTAVEIAAKTYPLMTMLDHNPAASTALRKNPAWVALAQKHQAALATAAACQESACYMTAFHLGAEETATAADALQAAYEAAPALRNAVDATLKETGAYGSGATVREAFLTDVAGVNATIDQYGEAGKTPYPKIDAMDVDLKSEKLLQELATTTKHLRAGSRPGDLYFVSNVRFAVDLLRINDREDPGHFEPMAKGYNAAAIAQAKKTKWAEYPYSAIMVPGAGPGKAGVSISETGILRLKYALEQYQQHKAPFFIVSGGSVHPAHTHVVEAVEMRKYLMEQMHVPASAIVIDPHARHTTTNVRNAVRELFHYGLPTDKPMMIVAEPVDIKMIGGAAFARRCMNELHYLPWTEMKTLSPTVIEMTPNRDSLRVDSLSPLDP